MKREPFNPNLIRVPPEERVLVAAGPITVSQVTSMVKRAIESGLPATLHVLGEVSNLKRHGSGHLYFTLKDGLSELSCVMWRSAAASVKFAPGDGLEVIATGAVEVFERAGRYQLYVRKLEPRGVGSLELAFRQLCEKLKREGLFDNRHKQPIPAYPSRIVLVTSPTGAAVGDMLATINRRYPCADVLVYPVRVQGDCAAGEIAAAVRSVNDNAERLGGVDVMIVGRGGGSLEDLWAFNEEIVARAIFASRVPLVSAVGHEEDVSVADLVADVRAATPTAAAELVVPVLEDVHADLAARVSGLTRGTLARTRLEEARFNTLLQRSVFRDPLLAVRLREQCIDEQGHRLHRALAERIRMNRRTLDRVEPVVQRIAPHAFLLRTAVRLRDVQHRLRWKMSRRLALAERLVAGETEKLQRCSPVPTVSMLKQSVDQRSQSLVASVRYRLSLLDETIRRQEELLGALSYRSVLGRGFSITRTRKRRVVRSISQLEDHEKIVTELADGEFEAEVVNLRQLELFDKPWVSEN